MNTSRKSLLSALAGGVVLFSIAACGSASSPAATAGSAPADCTPAHSGLSTLNDGKLTVSVFVSPPYSKIDGDSLSGVDGEIIKKLAAMECLALDAKSVDGAAVINSVISKRADLAIGGIYRSEEREEIMNLSDTAYRDGMVVLSEDRHKSVTDLEGKRTGVIQGYLWNSDLQKALGDDSVVVFQDTASLMADLESGRIDAAILTSAEGAFRAAASDQKLKAEPFEPSDQIESSTEPGQVVLAMVKGNDSLTLAFNENIKTMIEDGTIAALLEDEGMDPELAGSAG